MEFGIALIALVVVNVALFVHALWRERQIKRDRLEYALKAYILSGDRPFRTEGRYGK